MLQIAVAAASASESGEYLDIVAVRFGDNAFQLIIGYVAEQSAIFVGIAECDVDMRELVEVELAEWLIVPVGQIADYPVRSFALRRR